MSIIKINGIEYTTQTHFGKDIPADLQKVVRQVLFAAKKASMKGLMTCPRCDGNGICAERKHWIFVKMESQKKKVCTGKVCFQCRGDGTIFLTKIPHPMKVGWAIWKNMADETKWEVYAEKAQSTYYSPYGLVYRPIILRTLRKAMERNLDAMEGMDTESWIYQQHFAA